MILRRKYNGAKIDTEAVGTGYRLQSTDYGERMYGNNKLDVEDLQIYQLGYKLMLEIHNVTMGFPKIEQYGGIADQLRRSSKSIVANIVEGFGKQRFYKDEFKRMLVYSIGSCDETMLWIKTSKDLGYIDSSLSDRYISQYKILVKKISSFTHNVKGK